MKIVIIGAGVAGLAIGWRLVQAGADVTILERAQPGAGATAASAGMIAVTAENLHAEPVEVEFAKKSNALWPDFAKEIEAVSGRSIDWRRAGALILAKDAIALARLERKAGVPVLDAAAVRERVPLLASDFAGALWAEGDSHVDSRALGLALAAAFRKEGGRLLTNEAATEIEQRGGKALAVRTPFGLYEADLFLLAAGAWSGLLADFAAAIKPVKGQMIALSPPAGVALPSPVIWGEGIYAVPRGGQLLIGATMEEVGLDTRPTDAAREFLWSAAARLFAGAGDWTLADHWAGLRPGSPDGLPMLGPTPVEGLWLASGQFRNGILFAPAVAELMRDQILGRSPGLAAFAPRRFENVKA